jgi:hypothetical protein
LRGRFSWGKGYGTFSVSHSDVERVAAYVATQDEHHRRKSFRDEFELFIKKYGVAKGLKPLETVSVLMESRITGLKPGANERP